MAQLSMLRAGVFDWLESFASEQLSERGGELLVRVSADLMLHSVKHQLCGVVCNYSTTVVQCRCASSLCIWPLSPMPQQPVEGGRDLVYSVVACTCNRVWLRCVVVPEGACSTFSCHICVTQAAVLHRRCHRCVIVTALLLGIGSQRVNGLWAVWCGGRTRSGMGAFFGSSQHTFASVFQVFLALFLLSLFSPM